MFSSAFFREQKCLLWQPFGKVAIMEKYTSSEGLRVEKLLMNIKAAIHKN